jgi:hypothetical protein
VEGDAPDRNQMPFTPEAKRALELSLREALALGHNYIGTEHVLLGLVRADPEIADADAVRAAVVAELTARGVASDPPRPFPPPFRARRPRRHEVHRLDGPPDTWPAQLDAFAREGWRVISVVATGDGHHAVLARPR